MFQFEHSTGITLAIPRPTLHKGCDHILLARASGAPFRYSSRNQRDHPGDIQVKPSVDDGIDTLPVQLD